MNLFFYILALTNLVLIHVPSHCHGLEKTTREKGVNEPVATSRPISTIKYRGKTVKLNERALYLNANLKDSEMGPYTFRSLKNVAEFAKDGTEAMPTVIYMEPNVYWTDDPNASNKENKLIGLVMPQANITLIGLDGKPEHTIIAGNRGQMAGAIGNWNTIAVGDGFKAYNVTFGNYCNEDLIYPLDPTKNLPKRQSTITQAQVLTKAHNGKMDKWIFENCRFISYLNTFAAGNQPHRAYYKNCYLQCTDDAVGSGDYSVFEKCYFRFYSNHPSWGGSRVLQAYLGCKFETVLRDPRANSTLYFAKNNSIFAVIDAQFEGNATALGWTDVPQDHVRHYVSNNTLNGQNIQISPSKPDLSIHLKGKSLTPYKIGTEYNIYNLLRGNDDWDPAGQKDRLSDFKDLPFRMELVADKTKLKGAENEQASVSYNIYPERIRKMTRLKWFVSDTTLLSLVQKSDGTIRVTAMNSSDITQRAYVKAETEQGIESLVYFEISGIAQEAPSFTRTPILQGPESGKLSLRYELNLNNRKDNSIISWYRSSSKNASDSIKVGVSTTTTPMSSYPLTTGDIGYYLNAVIYPKHNTSKPGNPVFVQSRKIVKTDVLTSSIITDFKNFPTSRNSLIREGFWTADTYRPKDLSKDFVWTPDDGNGWEFGWGSDATAERQGLMTVGRGARLLYTQAERHSDMSLVLDLSPHKAAGQGFGSATGQYLDIYTKYDTKSQTGYGLRIERTPKYGNGVQFTLFKFDNGIGTAISNSQHSSVFLPGCKVELRVSKNIISARVSTSSAQQQGQKDSGLLHTVNLEARVEGNEYGGFGIQHTGSTGGASRIMLEGLEVTYTK